MSPEELLARLNTISTIPHNQTIDLNQILPNGRTVIEEFVHTQDPQNISNLFAQIAQ